MFKNFRSKYLNTIEYSVLPFPMTFFCMAGAWCPSNWSDKWKILYSLYSLFILSNTILMGLQMAIYSVLLIHERDVDLNTIFTLTALCNGMTKLFTVLLDRRWVMEILKMAFNERLCEPRNKDELRIVQDHNKNMENVQVAYSLTIIVGLLVKFSVFFIHMSLEESDIADPYKKLPVPTWYPFDIGKTKYLIIAQLQQMVAGYVVVCSHVSTDLLLSDLMLQVCLLLKLLRYRLLIKHNNIFYDKMAQLDVDRTEYEQKEVAMLARDHQQILNFADCINENFTTWLLLLIFTGAPNLCMNVYQIVSPRYTFIQIISPIAILFLCLVEIVLVCWCGNEVTLHSIDISDAAYEGGWMEIQNSAKKDFVLIMGRSYYRPVVLSIIHLFPLNVDSLVKIIKLAYTALNLMNKVQN